MLKLSQVGRLQGLVFMGDMAGEDFVGYAGTYRENKNRAAAASIQAFKTLFPHYHDDFQPVARVANDRVFWK